MAKATMRSERYVADVTVGRHAVVADTSWQGVGGDVGMSPHNLLDSALAACIAMTIQIAADRRDTALEGVTVEVQHTTLSEGTAFECRLTLEGPLTDNERAGLLRIAHNCPVSKLLESPSDINIEIAGT